jgi:TRAP-type mannitol/chloroaromatic compound transport system permease large subunit
MLMGMYVLYVLFLAVFKPHQVPALPAQARSYREPNGSGGYTSLTVLAALSATVSIFLARHMAEVHTWWQGELVTSVPTDEKVVVSMCGGTAVALVIALINKGFKLGLLSRLAERVTFVLIPPLLLIFLVLGTIFLGIATPTEGGAMGAMGALIMGWSRKRLDMKLLKQALASTTKLSSFVMFILIGATTFSLVFQAADGPIWVEHLLTTLPGGQVGFLIAVNVMVFFLAFFLDYFELSFIVVPLLAPVADKLGIDLIWFGVLLAVNMQTSFMHPPFGFALFFLRSVAPDKPYIDRVTRKTMQPVTTMQIYKGAIPFLLIQLTMVGVLIAFPGIVTGALDAKVEYNMESIGDQMRDTLGGPADSAPYGEEPSGDVEPAAPGAETPAPDAAPMPEPEASPADDPLKAMEDALKKPGN